MHEPDQSSSPIQLGVISAKIDLDKTPTVEDAFKNLASTGERYCVTKGDMHAHAMLFITELVDCGILKITDEQYRQLHDIYYQYNNTEEYLKNNISRFKQILEEIFKTVSKHLYVRFIGDLLADRGMQDYFILLIFKFLKEAKVGFEIIYSNHDHQFMLNFESGFSKKDFLGSNQSLSLENLYILIEKKIVEFDEIKILIAENYIPFLKLMDYENDYFYSHAPIDPLLKEKIARDLNVEYKNQNTLEVARTTYMINRVFQKKYAETGKLHQIPRSILTAVWARPENVFSFDREQFLERKSSLRLLGEQHRVHIHQGRMYCGEYGPKYIIHVNNAPDSTPSVHGHVGCDDRRVLKDASVRGSVIYPSQGASALFTNLDSEVGKGDQRVGTRSYYISRHQPFTREELAASDDDIVINTALAEDQNSDDCFVELDQAASQAIASLEKLRNEITVPLDTLDSQSGSTQKDRILKLEKKIREIDLDIQNTQNLVQAAKKKPRNEQEKQALSEKIKAYEESANKWRVSTLSPEEKKANTSIYIKVAACMMVVVAIATCVICPAALPFFLFLAVKAGVSCLAAQVVTSVVATSLVTYYGSHQVKKLKCEPNLTFFPKTHMLNFVGVAFPEYKKTDSENKISDTASIECTDRKLSTLSI